jgi:uroporphyrinogen-III decarboxylase
MEFLRDEYLDYMTFKAAPRPIFVELFGPLIGLDKEWREQGATPGELNLTAFGFDSVRRHRVNANTGLTGETAEVTEEETAEYIIKRDSLGRRMKLIKGYATISLPMNHPVSDMDSWLKLKSRYADHAARLAEGWLEKAKAARAAGAVIVAGIPGGFDEPRQLMGEEGVCLAPYEQPELLHDMLETIGSTAARVLGEVAAQVPIDILSVHEDMAGKSGPLWGPVQIQEFIRPYYRRVWDPLVERGARIFQQDSDGNMNPVIDDFLDCGLTCMYPCEPAAGMDMVALRQKYGKRLSFMGGIDKHVLRTTPEAIRRELEYKLQPCMREGGTVFGIDHRIPNGTPLANYRYYVRTARELLGLPPDPEPGWARMAF